MSWSWTRGSSGTIRPIFAITVNSALTLAVSTLPFNFVVKLYFLVRVANLACEYSAFVWLKYKEPLRQRPFRVGGGVVGAVILCLPSFSIALLAVVMSAVTDYMVVVWGVVTLVVIAILYPFKILWVWITHRIYNILSQTVLF